MNLLYQLYKKIWSSLMFEINSVLWCASVFWAVQNSVIDHSFSTWEWDTKSLSGIISLRLFKLHYGVIVPRVPIH